MGVGGSGGRGVKLESHSEPYTDLSVMVVRFCICSAPSIGD